MTLTFAPDDNRAYFQKMIGKLYKILPICEHQLDTKQAYIESLMRELHGSLYTIDNAHDRTQCMTVINTLMYLSVADYDPDIYRSEVFKCIRIVGNIGGELHGL